MVHGRDEFCLRRPEARERGLAVLGPEPPAVGRVDGEADDPPGMPRDRLDEPPRDADRRAAVLGRRRRQPEPQAARGFEQFETKVEVRVVAVEDHDLVARRQRLSCKPVEDLFFRPEAS